MPSDKPKTPSEMAPRELDAAVAEKVMGWAVVRDIRFWDHSSNNGRPCFVQYAEGKWGVVRHGGSGYEPWSPTTNDSDALGLVAVMRGKERPRDCTFKGAYNRVSVTWSDTGCACSWELWGYTYKAKHPCTGFAICLAALSALSPEGA